MKKLTEMTDRGFKRAMTNMQKKDALVRQAAKNLRCKPEEIVERIRILLAEIESKKEQIQEIKDKIK